MPHDFQFQADILKVSTVVHILLVNLGVQGHLNDSVWSFYEQIIYECSLLLSTVQIIEHSDVSITTLVLAP